MHAFRFKEAASEPQPDLLLPERRPPARPSLVGSDVVDAEYVTVIDGGRRSFDERIREQRASLRPNMVARQATAAKSRTSLRPLVEDLLGSLSGRMFTGVVAAICLAVFAAGGAMSRAFERLDGADTMAPLEFSHISLTPQDAGGMRVLRINAIIENRADAEQALPMVRADLMLDGAVVATATVAPATPTIGAGESRGISARVPYPGGKLPRLKLTFK